MIDSFRHRLSSNTLARACALTLSITVLSLFTQPGANAETIYIQAETHFSSKTTPDHGGQIAASLLDDLNHPVPDMPVEITLMDIDTGMTQQREAQTNADGRLSLELGLKPGKYQANLRFHGQDAYLATSDSKDIEILPCRIRTDIVFPHDTPSLTDPETNERRVLWPAGSPLQFTLSPEQPLCDSAPLVYMTSFGPNAKRITLKNNAPQDVSLPSPDTESVLALDVERIATAQTEAESRQIVISLHEALLADELEYIPRADGHDIRAKLRPPFADFPVVATLQFPDDPERPAHTETANDGEITFRLSEKISACHRVTVSPHHAEPVSAEICFVQTRSGHAGYWLPGLAALIIAGGTLMLAKRRVRPKLPPAPKLAGRAETVEQWPVHIPAKALRTISAGMAEILCIDEKTRLPLKATDITLIAGERRDTPEHWPFLCPIHTALRISAPGYLSYSGSFSTPGRIVITLQKRRDYIIRCFESAAEYLTGAHAAWGALTPAALMRDHNDEKIEQFCRCVETAAFGTDEISDEQIDEIYALMKKLPLRKEKR